MTSPRLSKERPSYKIQNCNQIIVRHEDLRRFAWKSTDKNYQENSILHVVIQHENASGSHRCFGGSTVGRATGRGRSATADASRATGGGRAASDKQGPIRCRGCLQERGASVVWEMARPPARGRASGAARAASPAASNGIAFGHPETLGERRDRIMDDDRNGLGNKWKIKEW